MRLLKCGSWCPTRLPVIKLPTRHTRRLRITLLNDFRLYRSGRRRLGWCRFRVGAGVEAGVGGDVSTGVGIGVTVHTPPRNEQGVIAGVPPLPGVSGQLLIADCLRLMTISAPLLSLEFTGAFSQWGDLGALATAPSL